MNKKEFYKLAGILETNGKASYEQVQGLYSLCLNLIDIIEDAESDNGDVFSTQGWEYLIGWN